MNPSFWKGKKVLVTGHTGFKGSWLSLWLTKCGANLVGYSLEPPTQPSLFDDANVAEGMVSIEGDIRDLDHLIKVFSEHKPEIVIHMAAQPLVRLSYDEPVETYSSNVMGTVNVLEAIRQVGGVKVVVNITSDKCYDNKEWVWGYRENEAMGGADPYSSSKGCAELVADAYRRSYFPSAAYEKHGIGLASVRAGNVIGGGDWALDRLVPDTMKAFIAKESVVIRFPHAIRPWQHVLEPLHGYILTAEKLWLEGGKFAEGWNFGPEDDDAQPVGWIVTKLSEKWGDDAQSQIDGSDNPHEANYLKLDASKAKMRLNWKPMLDLDGALAWTVDWYKAYANKENIREKTLAQISLYESLCDKHSGHS